MLNACLLYHCFMYVFQFSTILLCGNFRLLNWSWCKHLRCFWNHYIITEKSFEKLLIFPRDFSRIEASNLSFFFFFWVNCEQKIMKRLLVKLKHSTPLWWNPLLCLKHLTLIAFQTKAFRNTFTYERKCTLTTRNR